MPRPPPGRVLWLPAVATYSFLPNDKCEQDTLYDTVYLSLLFPSNKQTNTHMNTSFIVGSYFCFPIGHIKIIVLSVLHTLLAEYEQSIVAFHSSSPWTSNHLKDDSLCNPVSLPAIDIIIIIETKELPVFLPPNQSNPWSQVSCGTGIFTFQCVRDGVSLYSPRLFLCSLARTVGNIIRVSYQIRTPVLLLW